MESPDNRPAVDDRKWADDSCLRRGDLETPAFGGSMNKPADGGFFVA